MIYTPDNMYDHNNSCLHKFVFIVSRNHFKLIQPESDIAKFHLIFHSKYFSQLVQISCMYQEDVIINSEHFC